jgi:hypothetical protein
MIVWVMLTQALGQIPLIRPNPLLDLTGPAELTALALGIGGFLWITEKSDINMRFSLK